MKILLAIDDSKFAEGAIHTAISQVRKDHTQVLVLHVVDWNSFMPSPFPRVGDEPMYSARQLESVIETETRKAHELVKNAGERLRSAPIDRVVGVKSFSHGRGRAKSPSRSRAWEAPRVLHHCVEQP